MARGFWVLERFFLCIPGPYVQRHRAVKHRHKKEVDYWSTSFLLVNYGTELRKFLRIAKHICSETIQEIQFIAALGVFG
jgi:hypothetical protein